MAYQIEGREIAHDFEGYLTRMADWSRDLAAEIARADGVALTPAHWEIIDFVRAYYDEYLIAPSIRPLTKAISKALGPEKAALTYLDTLFPGGPAKQATKFAGLPKPTGCA